MKVITLDSHDGYEEGDVYDVPEHVATKLIAKGLVKAGPVPENKMAPRSENKAGPSPAVGAVVPSLSLPAARVLPMPTVVPLDDGGSTAAQVEAVTGKPPRKSYYKPTGRPRGRPRKEK